MPSVGGTIRRGRHSHEREDLVSEIRYRAGKCIAFLFLLAAVSLCPDDSASQGHPSARIYSLGGDAVSGIIDDYLTDLYLNPAFAALSDRTTINIGYRPHPGITPSIPYLTMDSHYNWIYDYHFYTFTERGTHEIVLHGLKLSRWRFALSSEWTAWGDDSTELEVNQWDNPPHNFSETYDQNYNKDEDDYWRFDLSAARPVGTDRIAGIRLGGYHAFNIDLHRDKYDDYDYDFFEFPFGVYLDRLVTHNRNTELITRQLSTFVQFGLLTNTGSKNPNWITAGISRRDIDMRAYSLRQDIHKYYNVDGYIESYSYKTREWRDRRECPLWKYDITGRCTLPKGIRLFLGGSFETCTYDSDWVDHFQLLEWDTFNEDDNLIRSEYSDEGRYRAFSLVTKIGKQVDVRDDLDVVAGFYGFFRRSWIEEDAFLRYTITAEEGSSHMALAHISPFGVENEYTDLYIFFPFALEYRITDYFSCFTGLQLRFQWKREVEKIDVPGFAWYYEHADLIVGDGGEGRIPRGVDETAWETVRRATMGISLHYGNRLFADLYFGSDLTPDSITSMIIDARYTF